MRKIAARTTERVRGSVLPQDEPAVVALRAILADPYGCRFCDSGKLRDPHRPHDDSCGYRLAEMVIATTAT